MADDDERSGTEDCGTPDPGGREEEDGGDAGDDDGLAGEGAENDEGNGEEEGADEDDEEDDDGEEEEDDEEDDGDEGNGAGKDGAGGRVGATPAASPQLPGGGNGGPGMSAAAAMMAAVAALEDGQPRPEDMATEEYISLLEEYREQCQMNGLYEQAETAHQVLNQIRKQVENRHLEAVRNRQLSERLGLEKAHLHEFQLFQQEWQAKFDEYDSNAALLVQQTKSRHATELQEYFTKLHQQMSRPKASGELLNLRRVEEALARQKKYTEAREVKAKADELESKELAVFEADKAERITKLTRRMVLRQRQELMAVDQRIRSGRAEQEKLRQRDMQRLAKRYHNIKQGLVAAQNIERARTETFLAKHHKRMDEVEAKVDLSAGSSALLGGIVGNPDQSVSASIEELLVAATEATSKTAGMSASMLSSPAPQPSAGYHFPNAAAPPSRRTPRGGTSMATPRSSSSFAALEAVYGGDPMHSSAASSSGKYRAVSSASTTQTTGRDRKKLPAIGSSAASTSHDSDRVAASALSNATGVNIPKLALKHATAVYGKPPASAHSSSAGSSRRPKVNGGHL